jgi:UDP-N-acetylmuramoyl-L-alanyl-D-glutamate--2,6-diaminopimelate ligase
VILGPFCSETMRLEYLSKIIRPLTIRGPQDIEIEGIAYDSRQVRQGDLFVALRGQNREGRDFIEEAIHRGAVAVVEQSGDVGRRKVTTICVEDSRRALAEIACAFFSEPSHSLQLIGITGTNGKSTTAFMCRDILKAAGRTPGLIGTIRYEIGERSIPASRTTPEAPDLQFLLDQMLRAGCQSAVMEVSSHGLDQKRVWGIDFDVGVFTNLTQDHLDYHKTLDQYFGAKTLLFRGLGQKEKSASAVINIDDPWGMQLAHTDGVGARQITFGTHPAAMVRAGRIDLSSDGSAFDFTTPWGEGQVRMKLLGRFNVSNALAAIGACGALGVDPNLAAEALSEIAFVPGRLEPIHNRRGLSIFVDYAHTPDALANALRTLREITDKRLLVVFGCGGNRDRSKRPIMGAAAATLADYSIVTSDNPRGEDPAAIIAEITSGFGACNNLEAEVNREKAIARALALACPGDTVLLAGKGHENVQEFANTVVPFDDREVVKRLLNQS